ncbi:hypothetical protein F4802DRAFT_600741 [Xylaria palmicola]|nr:hypothetical protein F4802DRAFT_600741 [Xylaria palmicola]
MPTSQKTDVFRFFALENTQEDRAEKRRAQLRRAQVTYKERKERYAKALENRVAEARESEVNLCQQIHDLQETVRKLAGFIHDQGLQVPDELRVAIESSQFHEDHPESDWAPQHGHQPLVQVQTISDETIPANPQQSTLRDERIDGEPTSDPSDLYLGDLDPLAVGMEFVLTLERPCFDHLCHTPDKTYEPRGHALTLSGQLAKAIPGRILDPRTACETFRREVPEKSLHSLLALSLDLCPEAEITPIQAWHHIRSQPLFGALEARKLWDLAERLLREARCHGFGAVIHQDIFEKTMSETLLASRAL